MMSEVINRPIVSIITPVYNASKFIPRLLASVANQEFSRWEHIIVDDCSKDDSLSLLKKAALNNSQIKIIRLSENSGPVVARNQAITRASGKYLAFLDADDFWMPNKLTTQVMFMEKHDVTITYSDYRIISEDGKLVGKRISGFNRIGWELHHMTRYLGCLTIMVNREKALDFKFPDILTAYRAEDFLAWSNVIQNFGPALRCPHDLARYSKTANSRSNSGINAAKSVWLLYRFVEKISLGKAGLYFFSYLMFATFKRVWFRPKIMSLIIDGEAAKKYILGDAK